MDIENVVQTVFVSCVQQLAKAINIRVWILKMLYLFLVFCRY